MKLKLILTSLALLALTSCQKIDIPDDKWPDDFQHFMLQCKKINTHIYDTRPATLPHYLKEHFEFKPIKWKGYFESFRTNDKSPEVYFRNSSELIKSTSYFMPCVKFRPHPEYIEKWKQISYGTLVEFAGTINWVHMKTIRDTPYFYVEVSDLTPLSLLDNGPKIIRTIDFTSNAPEWDKETLDILEATFRYLFDKKEYSQNQHELFDSYFITIGGQDPPEELLKRFSQHIPPVKKASDLKRNMPIFKQGGYPYYISSITWLSDTEVNVKGGSLFLACEKNHIIKENKKWVGIADSECMHIDPVPDS